MKTAIRILVSSFFLCLAAQTQSLNGNADFWLARGGCWTLSDSLITAHAYWDSAKLYSKKSYDDFVFEVRLTKVAESGPISVLFRYDEEKDEGYHLMCYPLSSPNFAKVVGKKSSYLYLGSSIFWNLGMNQWNTVRIEAVGSRFSFYVNGKHIYTQYGREYTGGRVGLIVWGDPRQTAHFKVMRLEKK